MGPALWSNSQAQGSLLLSRSAQISVPWSLSCICYLLREVKLRVGVGGQGCVWLGRAAWSGWLAKCKFAGREAGQVSLCRAVGSRGRGLPSGLNAHSPFSCALLPNPTPGQGVLCVPLPPPCREVFIVAQVEKEFSYSARNRVQLWEGVGERSVLPPDGLVTRISFR